MPEAAWLILRAGSLRQDALHLLMHMILSATVLDVTSSVLGEVLKGLGKELAKLPPVVFEESWRLGKVLESWELYEENLGLGDAPHRGISFRDSRAS